MYSAFYVLKEAFSVAVIISANIEVKNLCL